MTKIIRLEHLNNKSLDEIIELYRSGYTLDEKPQFSVQQLQPPIDISTLSTIGTIFVAGLATGMITLLLIKRHEKETLKQ